MQATVVIPTHNRSSILRMCLNALFEQNMVKDEFEIVIVDDGSRDDTKDVVEEMMKTAPVKLRYFYQKNQGQGVARNTGIAHADGKIIIMIGDDIIVQPDFVQEHLSSHRSHIHESDAVLGLTLWHPEITINPFMDFMTNGTAILGRFGGHQFAYDKLEGKDTADYNFFYTSNISLKRSLLLQYPFDTDFSSYGWEDIELGYRLTKQADMHLYYNREALGYHYHELSEDSLPGRMRAIGRSVHIFHRKYPELNKVPPLWKQTIFSFFANDVVVGLLRHLNRLSRNKLYAYYYYALSKKYYMEGLIEGAKDVTKEV